MVEKGEDSRLVSVKHFMQALYYTKHSTLQTKIKINIIISKAYPCAFPPGRPATFSIAAGPLGKSASCKGTVPERRAGTTPASTVPGLGDRKRVCSQTSLYPAIARGIRRKMGLFH